MNAEALAQAAKACRDSSDALMRAADDADVFIHRCPDAGAGMKRIADEMRHRATGLRVAASFLSRWAPHHDAGELLAALEAGDDVFVVRGCPAVVVAGDPDTAPGRATLGARIGRLLWWRRSSNAKAA